MKRALITGVTGQDGAYLAEFLLAKGYVRSTWIKRRTSLFTTIALTIFTKIRTNLGGDSCFTMATSLTL